METNSLYGSVDVSRDLNAEKVRRRLLKESIGQYANQIAIQHARAMGLGLQSTLTLEHWAEILDKHNWSCAYCLARGVPLDIEHSIPISRGGHNVPENVVPACPLCNSSKGDLTVEEWLARQAEQKLLQMDERVGGTSLAALMVPMAISTEPIKADA